MTGNEHTRAKPRRACFSGVTLSSPSYGELLDNMAKLNNVIEVDFNGGFSKTYGLIGNQAREKLIKKLGWTTVDGNSYKPASKNAPPAEPQPQPKPEAANDF
jgi:hypothetical protein